MTETLVRKELTDDNDHEQWVADAAASLEVITDAVQAELPADATSQTVADGVDKAVADLIHDASVSANPIDPEKALEVGALEVIENEELGMMAIDDTAAALGEADIESLGRMLQLVEHELGPASTSAVMGAIDAVHHDTPNVVYQEGSAVAHNQPGWEQFDKSMEVPVVAERTPSQRMEEAVAELIAQHNAATHRYATTKDPSALDNLSLSRLNVLGEIRTAEIETIDLSLVSEAFKAIQRIDHHSHETVEHHDQSYQRQLTMGLLDTVPEDVLQAMVRSPKDSEGGAVRYTLNELARHAEKGDLVVARTIVRAYGIESWDSFSAMHPPGTKMDNEALQFVRDHPVFLIARAVENETEHASTEEEKMAIVKNFSKEHLMALGLSSELVDKAIHAMRGRITIPDGVQSDARIVDEWYVAKELASFTERVQALGLEKVQILAEKAGIVNFGNFTIDQLETTLGLIQGDQNVIDRLREGDCSLLVFDGTEDWNGSFGSAGKEFEGAGGRVIAFEVSSMAEDAEELGTRIALLEANGVKVSTLVLGGHGVPGLVGMGDGALAYRRIPEDPSIIPVAQSDTFKRLFKRLKPSRETGRASIIIRSCSQAQPGIKGVSTAMRIAREAGRHVPVDTYAADTVTTMRRSSESSMTYAHGDAVKFSVDNAGLPKRSRVSEIPLDGAFRQDDKVDDRLISKSDL